jgi:pimeloyl-ACP methyl ester carboxylesterase
MSRPIHFAIGVCLLFTLAAGAAQSKSTVTYQIPVVDEHVRLGQLMEVALLEAGLAIPFDHMRADIRFRVTGKNHYVLLLTNAVTTPFGVSLATDFKQLTITVDRQIIRKRVNQLEAWLRAKLNHPAVFALRQINPESTGPPVVLVHGIDSGIERLRGAATALSKRGYDAYLFEFPDDTDILSSARQLGRLLGGLRSRTNQRISVVTTSMGGVVTRAWLELELSDAPPLSKRTEVSRFIACVPPFAGAPAAHFHLISEVAQVLSEAIAGQFSSLFLWDGFGQAGDDLKPGSALMQRFKKTTRRSDVTYSIIAGQGGIIPDIVFDATEQWLKARIREAGPIEASAWTILENMLSMSRAVGQGRGDGVIPISTTRLAGVDDYVLTDMNHLQCLEGKEANQRTIPGLDLVLKRLPSP